MYSKIALVQAFAGVALAGTVIWDGRFNDLSSSSDLNNWSWSNQVGPYQYYIHGSGSVTQYVNLSPSYKNPADTLSNQGVKISIDKTAYWNGQNMRRTELIPQTSAGINQGQTYYHFSVKRTNTNAPRDDLEHQVNFFESHFTELKYGTNSGGSGSDPTLKWCIQGQTKWSTTFDADVWHNVAYDINFSTNQVSFWHSTGSDPLVLTAGPFSVSTSSNGADWHLGVLRLPMNSDLQSPDVEDWYFSGVYVETGSINTQIGSGGSNPTTTRSTTTPVRTSTTTLRTSTTTRVTTPVTTTRTTTPATTRATTPATTPSTTPATTPGGAAQSKWGQCGGIGWTGPTNCVSGSTCQVLNPYYSQCL